MTQPPLLMFSELGNRWYIVTKYRMTDGVSVSGRNAGEKGRYLVAERKYDVTERMEAIFKSRDDATLARLARRRKGKKN